MNGLAPTGMDPVSVLDFLAVMRDGVTTVSGRRPVIVVPTLEVLRPTFAFLKGLPPTDLLLTGGWKLLGMPVVLDPTVPPETLYVLPA